MGGPDFDRNTVDSSLAKLDGRQVNVLIDSTGGSLGTGLSVSAAFSRHGNVCVHFTGLNASAATIASLGARRVTMDKGAMYLVHQCSIGFFEWGSMNADQFASMIKDCQKVKADLDKMDSTVAALYAARCKRKPEELLGLMKEGAWLTSDEALEWGFVDEVTELAEDEAPELTAELMSAMVAEGMPLPFMAPTKPASLIAAPEVGSSTGPLARLLGSLATLFKPSENRKPNYMDKKFTHICAALGCESMTLADGAASLQESALDKLEARIADLEAEAEAKDAEIADLNARLDKDPAAAGAQVTVNNAGGAAGAHEPVTDSVKEFCDTSASAKSLYDSLP